ncbi:MAG: hypothetical protein NUV96_02110 [Candidatus Colwellbacteria bacterium]|nr:hypothetical protein [Candidatus Colwellbacteria bacterium]
MKNFLNKINIIIGKIIPKLEVFGLEISDGLVRLYDIGKSNHRPRHIFLRLTPGVVVNGKVENQQALQNSLIELHRRVSNNLKKPINVIASIPINKIYIQPFNLPTLAKDNLRESAELNMRMISPIDVSKAYYDWLEIGENATQDQLDMVAAFVSKDVTDKFVETLQGANFGVAAVEFSSLSLIRAALKNGLINRDTPSLLLQMDQGGLSFAISHMGELYFHHFTEWNRYMGGGKNIDINIFKEGVVDEVRKLINFYLTNFKTNDIKNILIIAENLTEEVKTALQANLPDTQIKTVNFNEVNSAYGSAIRGRISRSQDDSISLAGLSAVDVFRKGQITDFISIWRNLIFTTTGFLLLVFLGSALLLQQTAEKVKSSDPFTIGDENSIELARLEKEAEEFNRNVEMLQMLSAQASPSYGIVKRLTSLMGTGIGLRRMLVNMGSGDIIVGGTANTEALARAFKDKLDDDEMFTEVDLPLQEFITRLDDKIDFLINAKLENFGSPGTPS